MPQTLSAWPAISFAFQVLFVVSTTFVLFFWLMARYDASRLGSFIFLAPAFGVFFGWLILDETIDIRLLAGAVLICSGIYLVNKPERR